MLKQKIWKLLHWVAFKAAIGQLLQDMLRMTNLATWQHEVDVVSPTPGHGKTHGIYHWDAPPRTPMATRIPPELNSYKSLLYHSARGACIPRYSPEKKLKLVMGGQIPPAEPMSCRVTRWPLSFDDSRHTCLEKRDSNNMYIYVIIYT